MKTVIACLMLVAAAQAVDWANVRPMVKVRPSILPTVPSTGRIIGGSLATVGQFKYQVGIIVEGFFFCGGSLISDSVVLTAAQCVSKFTSWEIHAGALNIHDETEPGRVIVTTTDGIGHESYGSLSIINDIAVVHLGRSVSGPNIEAVRLPARSSEGNLFVGERVRVSGWGEISDAAPGITNDLQFVDVTVITNEECAVTYGNIRDSNICVGTQGGTESTCNGDSGGPLVINEADGIPTEIGIVSFGSKSGCQSSAPVAFTRTTFYLDWIAANAGVTIRP